MVIDPSLPLDQVTERYFDFLRTSDNGVTVLTRVHTSPPTRRGDYHVIDPDMRPTNRDTGVCEQTALGLSWRAVLSARNNIAAAYNWAKADGLDPDDARDRQLDVEAAIALQADVYVSDNRFALTQRFNNGMFACSPREAMAIVGLHQRLQDRLVVDTPPFSSVLGLRDAEYVQAWAMLPNTLALFARRVSPPADPTRWKDLVRVAHVRLERCLRARDQILVRSIHPTMSFPFDTNDALVERIALNLSAMFDALARAINAAIELGRQEQRCFLTNKDFRRCLPGPITNVLATSESVALLGAIGDLRNTIHHVALSHAAEFDGRGKVSENYVVLPASDARMFRQYVATLRRSSQWIAKDFDEFGLVLRPVPLIEEMMTKSVLLFETVVSKVDWPGTVDEDLRVRSDDPGEWWMYYSPTVNLVAALYGLEPQ